MSNMVATSEPRSGAFSEKEEGSLEQSPTLWLALHRLVSEQAEDLDPTPSAEELSAYVTGGGSLSEQKLEHIRDYLAVYPEALLSVGGRGLPEPTQEARAKEAEIWSELWQRLREAERDPRVERTQSALRALARRVGVAQQELQPGRIRGFVSALLDVISELSTTLDLPDRNSRLLDRAALQGSFPVLVLSCRRHYTAAARYLLSEWQAVGESLGLLRPGPATQPLAPPEGSGGFALRSSERELLWIFQAAVLEELRSSDAQRRGRETIDVILSSLGLSYAQAGQLLGVSTATVRRWHRGATAISTERLATLAEVEDAITPQEITSTYNNFFEFGSSKRIAEAAQALKIRPWTITLDGMVLPGTEFTGVHVASMSINLGNVLRFFGKADQPGLMNALVGVGAVIYYSSDVFRTAGLTGPSGAETASLAVGGVNTLGALLSIWLTSRYGRRPLFRLRHGRGAARDRRRKLARRGVGSVRRAASAVTRGGEARASVPRGAARPARAAARGGRRARRARHGWPSRGCGLHRERAPGRRGWRR